MPWCETCAKFWNPSSMTPEGNCPTCGRSLAAAAAPARTAGEQPADGAEPVPVAGQRLTGADLRELAGKEARAPWHFKLMVVALALYLTWRIVDLVIKVVT